MQAFFALIVWVRLVTAQKLREEHPWYHTGDEIRSQLQALAGDCNGAQFEISTRTAFNGGANAGQQVEMDVVRVSRGSSAGKNKAFFVFGEHARELISPES